MCCVCVDMGGLVVVYTTVAVQAFRMQSRGRSQQYQFSIRKRSLKNAKPKEREKKMGGEGKNKIKWSGKQQRCRGTKERENLLQQKRGWEGGKGSRKERNLKGVCVFFFATGETPRTHVRARSERGVSRRESWGYNLHIHMGGLYTGRHAVSHTQSLPPPAPGFWLPTTAGMAHPERVYTPQKYVVADGRKWAHQRGGEEQSADTLRLSTSG